jgi:ParB family chromosome partitioning protein
MQIDVKQTELREIPVDKIERNPENPRIVFRPTELEELLESIRRYGVQVPISVYRDRNRYVLIDGERRWRCSIKLNRRTISALVQEKPDPLTNLLLMYNIHSLREQWDLLTIALKLPRVIDMLTEREGRKPNERELSAQTGLSRGVIRRSKLLIELPDYYRGLILTELKKPKAQQRLTEDFFIEMERSLKTVERAMPEIVRDKTNVRNVLIQKYKTEIIDNMTDFRFVSKIARAERVEADRTRAREVLERLFAQNMYSIDEAYRDSVSLAYSGRDLITRIKGLIERLQALRERDIDEETRAALRELVDKISALIPTQR